MVRYYDIGCLIRRLRDGIDHEEICDAEKVMEEAADELQRLNDLVKELMERR